MVGKGVLILIMSFLTYSCDGNVKMQTAEAYDSNTQLESRFALMVKEIEIGKAFSLDQLKRVNTFDDELKKLSSVECGGFFNKEENGDEEEIVYQYGNMTINIVGNQGVITQIIGINDSLHIKYNGLMFDNTFNPKSLNLEKFEVYENKATVSDNIIGIESTDIKATYDIMYSVRERSSDDLLYLYFLNNKLVAVTALVQC